MFWVQNYQFLSFGIYPENGLQDYHSGWVLAFNDNIDNNKYLFYYLMHALEEDKLDSPAWGSFSSAKWFVEMKHNGQLQGQKQTHTFHYVLQKKNLHNFNNTYNKKYHVFFR